MVLAEAFMSKCYRICPYMSSHGSVYSDIFRKIFTKLHLRFITQTIDINFLIYDKIKDEI